MKIVLTARRHPSMSRPQFFDYLRHTHWPLVASFSDVEELLTAYTQNHSMRPDDGADIATPFRRAVDRDSVIEIWVDQSDSLDRLHKVKNYMDYVRPDEGRFNDLPSLVILLSNETEVFTLPAPGRLKRFDFLYRRRDQAPETFQQTLRSTLAGWALDPVFQAIADRQTLHLPVGKLDPGSSADAGCDAVLATWASSLESLARLAVPRFATPLQSLADMERSFSVVAVTFPIKQAIKF